MQIKILNYLQLLEYGKHFKIVSFPLQNPKKIKLIYLIILLPIFIFNSPREQLASDKHGLHIILSNV